MGSANSYDGFTDMVSVTLNQNVGRLLMPLARYVGPVVPAAKLLPCVLMSRHARTLAVPLVRLPNCVASSHSDSRLSSSAGERPLPGIHCAVVVVVVVVDVVVDVVVVEVVVEVVVATHDETSPTGSHVPASLHIKVNGSVPPPAS